MPNYLGPQTASYEAAFGRALAKYYDCPLGTYLIADPNRGYTGDMIERYAYGLLAQGVQDMHIYTLQYPAECSYIASSDIHKGVKRISYTAGAIEDRLLASQIMDADVAIGWSKTTDVWDLAVPPHDPEPVERLVVALALDSQWSLVESDSVHERETPGGKKIVFKKPFHKFRFLELQLTVRSF